MKLLLLPVALFALLAAGCKDTCSCKKVACPAFNDAWFDKWFPKNNTTNVVYKTNTGNTDTFYIWQEYKSGSYEANKGCYNSASGCTADAEIYFTSPPPNTGSSKERISYFFSTPFTNPTTEKKITFKLYGFTASGLDINEKGIAVFGNGITSSNLPAVTLNGTSFSNVQVLQRDTISIKDAGPYKVYLSLNTGMVAYETYPGALLWVKQ